VVRIVVLLFSIANLGPDEAQYWSWSEDLDFGYFSKPPMIAWIIALTTGLFGESEWAIRLSSPLIHAGTSLIVFVLGRDLYDERVGLWASLIYLTMPAVFFSSGLITTDVPLLFFWSIALLSLHRLLNTKSIGWAVLTGLAIGLGLMSKYAMIYFLLCAVIYVCLSKSHRWLLVSRHSALILALIAVCLAPNIYWNAQAGFPTFTHTAANANWQGNMFNPGKMLEFFGGQFGVFGPFLFGLLLWGAWVVLRRPPSEPTPAIASDRFLLSFCLPILALTLTQAFLSRANANWAATAYIAATIFVAGWGVRSQLRVLLPASIGLHLIIGGFLYVLITVPGTIEATGQSNSFKRIRGWDTIGTRITEIESSNTFRAIMSDDRLITAELLYYVHPANAEIAQWDDDLHATHHYELTIPLTLEQGKSVLLVTKKEEPTSILSHFETADYVEEITVITGIGKSRTLHLYALQNYRGRGE
jgi:4-amino-4-deoxy-L-arabinose transferase-like glycosyltransferase